MDPEGKEAPRLTSLHRLNLLVHPLWRVSPDHIDPSAVARFDRERRAMAGYIVDHMTPDKSDEATVVMPLLTNHDLGGTLSLTRSKIRTSPEFVQWTGMYKDILHHAHPRRNLILGPNFVDNVEQLGMSPELLIQRLDHKGFKLTSSTQVVVGGELLTACVDEAVEKLLSLPVINRLTIDRQATLTAGYMFNSHPMLEEEDWKRFARDFQNRGFNVEATPQSVLISKPNLLGTV